VNAYASPGEFCRLFETNMNRFYFLSLVLTAEHRTGEKCFADALEDCLGSSTVFLEWSQRWAVHRVIKNAIRIVNPAQNNVSAGAQSLAYHDESELDTVKRAIISLPALERFVFVMTILESYSDRECSSFVGCSLAEIQPARERAVRQLAAESGIIKEVWRASASA
jgi:hypothetical protein